jgi:hypothetical protein
VGSVHQWSNSTANRVTCAECAALLFHSQHFSCKVVTMAAADRVRLDLEALACSAAHVTGQGEDLATARVIG